MVDVDGVDGGGVHLGDGEGGGGGVDEGGEAFAVGAAELLGVVEAGAGEGAQGVGGEDDGGGDDGAEECAAADLVHTGDEAEAAAAEARFVAAGASG